MLAVNVSTKTIDEYVHTYIHTCHRLCTIMTFAQNVLYHIHIIRYYLTFLLGGGRDSFAGDCSLSPYFGICEG